MEEDYQKICLYFMKALNLTSQYNDLVFLEYDKATEIVTATFCNGYQKHINVHMDSGSAMIRDIMAQL